MNSCYIIIRRDESLTFITYIPYRANKDERASLLEHRHECVRQLGEEHFIESIICKEIGEVTDSRSWEERDAEQQSQDAVIGPISEHTAQESHEPGEDDLIDAGYRQNKCRLCDRRMKNEISPEALEALTQLHTPGVAVQIVFSFPILPPVQSASNIL